jgi:hypothetical protein
MATAPNQVADDCNVSMISIILSYWLDRRNDTALYSTSMHYYYGNKGMYYKLVYSSMESIYSSSSTITSSYSSSEGFL